MMDKAKPDLVSQDTAAASNTTARQPSLNVKVSPVRSLIRLAIGSVELGAESLLNRLAELEATPAQTVKENTEQTSVVSPPEYAGPTEPETPSSTLDLARLIAIGVIFDTQERLENGVRKFGRAGNAANRLIIRASKPFRWIPGIKPLQRSIDRLASRGEQEVSRWITIGRREEQESKSLAERAIIDTVGEYIEYLAEHPAVEELVEEQSTSLATEVVEEVRERAVSLDTFLEGIARTMLRRAPRINLPQPPTSVKMSATTLRNRPEVKGKVQ